MPVIKVFFIRHSVRPILAGLIFYKILTIIVTAVLKKPCSSAVVKVVSLGDEVGGIICWSRNLRWRC